MNVLQQEQLWANLSEILVNKQIEFNKAKKLKSLTKKEIIEAEKKLRKMSYLVWLISPKVKNIELKHYALSRCLLDFNSFDGASK